MCQPCKRHKHCGSADLCLDKLARFALPQILCGGRKQCVSCSDSVCFMWGIFPLSLHPGLYSGSCLLIHLFMYPSIHTSICSLTHPPYQPIHCWLAEACKSYLSCFFFFCFFFHSLNVYAADPKSLESHSLMVMDMGQHVVQDLAQPLTLHQVLVPGLEDRARAFPPLATAQQISPGILPRPCCVPPPLCVCSSLCCGVLCPSMSCPGL